MEHSESVETMAAERYALGEMTLEERDQFEEHFFDCRECAPSVRDEVSIAVATHHLIPKPAAAPRNQWWVAVPAAAALVAILGYQNMVTIPRLRADAPPAAHVVHPHPLLTAESREGSMPPFVAARDEEVQLYFDVPPETPYPSYVAEVRDAQGKVRASSPITAEEAREMVTFSIRPGILEAGKYDVVVSGVSPAKQSAVLKHYPFELSFR